MACGSVNHSFKFLLFMDKNCFIVLWISFLWVPYSGNACLTTWLGLNRHILPLCSFICCFVMLLLWVAVSCASMYPVLPFLFFIVYYCCQNSTSRFMILSWLMRPTVFGPIAEFAWKNFREKEEACDFLRSLPHTF